MPPMSSPLVTPRDYDLLAALDRCPFTARQLVKLSATFAYPFTSERKARQRLQVLCGSGRVRRGRYLAIADRGAGAPSYYFLSPQGHRILHGPEAMPPCKRAFRPIGIAHQHHSHSLAEFVAHAAVCAGRANLAVSGFCRENSVCLQVGDETLYPDCAFQILPLASDELSFFVEIDNSSERIRSEKSLDSWQRKIRLYDAYQDRCTKRFRVLVVTTRSHERLRHILDAAAEMTRNAQRSLFYGIHLADFLTQPDALRASCFRDHNRRAVALIPSKRRSRARLDKTPRHPYVLPPATFTAPDVPGA